jgi:mRNA-degrading endonuclease RelE of RelBE toxin-antitoxin system
MPYSIDFDAGAVTDLRQFRKGDQVRILQAIEVHLIHEPMRQSKSRIKRLRVGTQPPYRLRVAEFRVYYDVNVETLTVAIFGIVHKDRSLEWLAAFGRREEGEG